MARVTSVTDKHPQVLRYAPVWQKIRDAVEGDHSARCAHLPPIPAHRQDEDARVAYEARAVWYNATARTVDALVGASHRREAVVTVPPRFAPRLDDLTNRGESFHHVAKHITREVLTYGRYALLVDATIGGDITNPMDRLPFLVGYNADSICNWRHRIERGRKVLEQVVLQEEHSIPAGFGSLQETRYRVLELDADGYVVCRVYRRGESGVFAEFEQIRPTRFGGERWTEIPFVVIGPNGVGFDVQKPPVLDLSEMNYSHFRVSADYENGTFTISQPTVVVVGGPDDMGPLRLGGSVQLPAGASMTLLEYRGDGLGFVERLLDTKKGEMAVLGSRLMESTKREAETAEAVRLRQYGDTSTLASVAASISDGMERAIGMACHINADPGPITVTLERRA